MTARAHAQGKEFPQNGNSVAGGFSHRSAESYRARLTGDSVPFSSRSLVLALSPSIAGCELPSVRDHAKLRAFQLADQLALRL
jgi:hypothetical protein